jgi:hypothetical protein
MLDFVLNLLLITKWLIFEKAKFDTVADQHHDDETNENKTKRLHV